MLKISEVFSFDLYKFVKTLFTVPFLFYNPVNYKHFGQIHTETHSLLKDCVLVLIVTKILLLYSSNTKLLFFTWMIERIIFFFSVKKGVEKEFSE